MYGPAERELVGYVCVHIIDDRRILPWHSRSARGRLGASFGCFQARLLRIHCLFMASFSPPWQVEHVLLYDFPRDPIEYMRRVGRTARAGRKGVVTVLAWGRQVRKEPSSAKSESPQASFVRGGGVESRFTVGVLILSWSRRKSKAG